MLSTPFSAGIATFNGLTLNVVDDGYFLQVTSGTLVPATSGDVDVTTEPVVPLVPNAPALVPQSDTGVSNSDRLTRYNGSAAAPLSFTVSGVNPAGSFVQLYNDHNPAHPIALGGRVKATGGTAIITLSGVALPDGTYQLAAAAGLTSAGTLSELSGTTSITIQSSLTVTATNPAGGAFVAALPSGRVSLTFSHALAGLTDGGPALTASDPTALELTTQGGSTLALTTVYRVNADGSSTIFLTPNLAPPAGVYSLLVDPNAFSDLAGNRLSGPSGVRLSFTITGPLGAPVKIKPISSQMIAPGGSLTLTFTASDPGVGRTLLYSLGSGAPAGATIDSRTGLFTWSPALAQAAHLQLRGNGGRPKRPGGNGLDCALHHRPGASASRERHPDGASQATSERRHDRHQHHIQRVDGPIGEPLRLLLVRHSDEGSYSQGDNHEARARPIHVALHRRQYRHPQAFEAVEAAPDVDRPRRRPGCERTDPWPGRIVHGALKRITCS